jgi:hypothetical protein
MAKKKTCNSFENSFLRRALCFVTPASRIPSTAGQNSSIPPVTIPSLRSHIYPKNARRRKSGHLQSSAMASSAPTASDGDSKISMAPAWYTTRLLRWAREHLREAVVASHAVAEIGTCRRSPQLQPLHTQPHLSTGLLQRPKQELQLPAAAALLLILNLRQRQNTERNCKRKTHKRKTQCARHKSGKQTTHSLSLLLIFWNLPQICSSVSLILPTNSLISL